MMSKPSAYACISPYSMPLWIILTKWPAPGGPQWRKPSDAEVTSASEGFLHCGPPGAGHFVKMIHNGIEYGLMQAYAEGFDIMRNAVSEALPADQRYDLDLGKIAE